METCLSNMLSAVIAIEYMDHGFQKKYRGILRILCFLAGCGVYFLTVAVFGRITVFESVLGFVYGVIVTIYGLAALKGKLGELLFYGILWMVIVLIGSYAAYGVLGLVTGRDLRELVEAEWGMRYYAFLSVAMLKFAMGRAVTGIYRKKGTVGTAEDWMIVLAFLVMFFLAHGMFSLELGVEDQGMRYCLTIGIMGGLFGLVLLLELCHWKLWKYREENLELSWKKEQEDRQQESLEDLCRMVREVNRFRHDLKGKLDVLYRLVQNGKYEEVRDHMEALQGALSRFPELPKDTGNEGLNAALIRTAQECQEKGIRFHYSILGSPGEIDSMDMGILLYNLFSNGIEACMEVSKERERRLELVLTSQKGETELQLLNSIGHSVFQENPGLESRKKDRRLHGFGMENIYRITEKYHGEYGCREEEDCFIQIISLRHS